MEASITVWPPVAVHHTTRDAMIGVCVLTPFSVQSWRFNTSAPRQRALILLLLWISAKQNQNNTLWCLGQDLSFYGLTYFERITSKERSFVNAFISIYFQVFFFAFSLWPKRGEIHDSHAAHLMYIFLTPVQFVTEKLQTFRNQVKRHTFM